MTEIDNNQLREPTEEELRLARCWKPEYAELNIPPDQTEIHRQWGMVDKSFKGGLKYSDYRDYTAVELEAMDLATFQRTWQAVEVKLLRNPRVTEDEKRAYIDECYFFGGFRLADAVFQHLDKAKIKRDGDGIGTLEMLEALRVSDEGTAKKIIFDHIPEANAADYSEETYPAPESSVFLTDSAREVLRRAAQLMDQSGSGWISSEHLLLALLETDSGNFHAHLKIEHIRSMGLEQSLRSYLGITVPSTLGVDLRAYQDYCSVERELTQLIQSELKKKYGDEKWWVEGVPKETRKICSSLREEEDCIFDADCYLLLIHLMKIMQAKENWKIFGRALESATGCRGKDESTAWMRRLNPIRNVVMHPVKRYVTSEDLEVIKNARRITNAFMARLGVRS